MAGAHEIVGDEEPDVPGAGDRDPHQCSPPDSMCACNSSVAVDLADEHQHVAFLADHVAGDDLRLAEPRDRGEPELPGPVQQGELLADGLGRDLALDDADARRWGRPSRCRVSAGSSRRSTWSVVHATVATVGMPRRW